MVIISNLIGGLGNQMFQYAAGRSLSLSLDTRLFLDISGFNNYGLHQGYELKRIFNFAADISNDDDVNYVLGYQSNHSIRKLLSLRSMRINYPP